LTSNPLIRLQSPGRVQLSCNFAGRVVVVILSPESRHRPPARLRDRTANPFSPVAATGSRRLGDKGYAEGAGWVSLRSTHPAAFEDKGYADRHRGSGQPIHLIGVEFSREQRRVVGFDVETPGG
jgi:hypothetical protein